METLDTPERLAPSGYHRHSLPAHFELGFWREPAGIHQEALECRSTYTRGRPFFGDYLTPNPVTSCPTSLRVSATSTLAM